MTDNDRTGIDLTKEALESDLVHDQKVEHENTHLGIKWAPLNIPLERRKQTAAVLFFLLLATCSIGFAFGIGYLLLFFN